VQRLKCRDCAKTFKQPLGGVVDGWRMTERCAHYIKHQAMLDTFIRVADHVGCDEKTVRSLAAEHIAWADNGYLPQLPEWLGIDETQIQGKMRCVITDIGRRRPIEMLEGRDKATITNWLNRFQDRSMVKGIAIDMWRPYRDLADEYFPGVPVVIDKFHVVRMANYCMERVRIRLGKQKSKGLRRHGVRSRHVLNKREASLSEQDRLTRDIWLENEPEMKAAYELKEAFYAIYTLPKAEAVAAYDAFAASVPAPIKPDFKVLLTAMRNWRTEILAYFDHPISNGYTEALNGVAKAVNRAGRGYTFPVLRARLLFRPTGIQNVPKIRGFRPLFPPHLSIYETCESCLGLFFMPLVRKAALPAVSRGQRSLLRSACDNCRRRFGLPMDDAHSVLVPGYANL
jgi:transposase